MKNFKFLFTLMLTLLAVVSCKKKNAQPHDDITTGLHVQDG